MNNFIDTVFNTAATDNKIKYKIIHADSTEEVVELQMYTPVTTTGTAMNKTFFDSIKDDLNSRLLTSNKASQAEAETGTNDTKYMTPLKTKQAIQKNLSIKTGTIGNNETIPQTAGFSHYAYFVSINEIAAPSVSGTASGATVTSQIRPVCSVDQSTRKVTVGIYQRRTTSGASVIWGNFVGGTANYLELAWN